MECGSFLSNIFVHCVEKALFAVPMFPPYVCSSIFWFLPFDCQQSCPKRALLQGDANIFLQLPFMVEERLIYKINSSSCAKTWPIQWFKNLINSRPIWVCIMAISHRSFRFRLRSTCCSSMSSLRLDDFVVRTMRTRYCWHCLTCSPPPATCSCYRRMWSSTGTACEQCWLIGSSTSASSTVCRWAVEKFFKIISCEVSLQNAIVSCVH